MAVDAFPSRRPRTIGTRSVNTATLLGGCGANIRACRPTPSTKTVRVRNATPEPRARHCAVEEDLGQPEWRIGHHPAKLADLRRAKGEVHDVAEAVGVDVRGLNPSEVLGKGACHMTAPTRRLEAGQMSGVAQGLDDIFEKRSRGPGRAGEVVEAVAPLEPLRHHGVRRVLQFDLRGFWLEPGLRGPARFSPRAQGRGATRPRQTRDGPRWRPSRRARRTDRQ